jgi:hypothetical protein
VKEQPPPIIVRPVPDTKIGGVAAHVYGFVADLQWRLISHWRSQ